jgi:hypothetical protein
VTRDQIIEQVGRAICKSRCETCYCDLRVMAAGRPAGGCFNTGYMNIARVAIATLESMGYHIADTGKMVAPPAETTSWEEKP